MAEIHDAVEEGDRSTVADILEQDPDAANSAADGDRPLHLCAVDDRVEIALVLIAAGADIEAPGDNGRRPLHCAAVHGAVKMAELLVRRGADLESLDAFGFSPLFTAARSGAPRSPRIVRLLIKAGSEIDLNSAVCLGDRDRVRSLLEQPGAVLTARFPLDLVPDAVALIRAETLGEVDPFDLDLGKVRKIVDRHLPALELLLAKGADANAYGLSPWPALLHAVQISDPRVTRVLLENQADPSTRTPDGRSAWRLSQASATKAEIRQLLKTFERDLP